MELPVFLWGEAVRHSIYILNCVSTRALSAQTPHEVLTGERPNLGHIKIFGCIAHMKVPSVHTSKLDDRSRSVINLGREAGTKGYRLYDPMTNQILVSRDVVFNERARWSWNQGEKQTSANHGNYTLFDNILGESSSAQTGDSESGEEHNSPVQSQYTGDGSTSSE